MRTSCDVRVISLPTRALIKVDFPALILAVTIILNSFLSINCLFSQYCSIKSLASLKLVISEFGFSKFQTNN